MTKLQEQVKEFHQTFDIKIEDKPTIPDADTAVLRLKLIQEEFEELEEALGFGYDPSTASYPMICKENFVCSRIDMTQIADALGDLLYVIYGAAVSFGIDLEPVTDEIHRSNMTKVGGYKREDGKWVKPDTYSPPDLVKVLEAQHKDGRLQSSR